MASNQNNAGALYFQESALVIHADTVMAGFDWISPGSAGEQEASSVLEQVRSMAATSASAASSCLEDGCTTTQRPRSKRQGQQGCCIVHLAASPHKAQHTVLELAWIAMTVVPRNDSHP